MSMPEARKDYDEGALVGFDKFWARAPNVTAVVDSSGRAWTRDDLMRQANQLSRALHFADLGRGDTIAIVAPNCAEFLVTYLAALQIGMYLVPINWHLTATEMRHILESAQPRALLVHDRVYGRLAGADIAKQLPKVRIAIGRIAAWTSWVDVLSAHSSEPLQDPVAGRVTFYSSATTGRPKAIVQSLDSAEFAPIRTLRFQRTPEGVRNVHLCTTMLYHAGGLLHTTCALHLGHTVVLMETWSPQLMLELIQSHRVTTMFVVPTMFVRLLKLAEDVRTRFDVSSLIQVIHSAAPCPIETKRHMIDWWGPIIWECYNGTEGQGTFASSEDWLRYPGTVGKPFPGVRIKILDHCGNELVPGEVGDIYLTDLPGCRFEYQDDRARTAAHRRGDFYTMGDVGYVNADGYLFICDRRHDVINCGGEKIFPAEIEQALIEHPAVLDCAAMPRKHDVLGQVPVALVQLAPGFEPTKTLTSDLLTSLMRTLSVVKLPRSIEYVTELPRAPNGKLYRRLLEDPQLLPVIANP